MFAGEYLTASFAEVYSVFDDAVRQVAARSEQVAVRARDKVRHVSAGVASLPIEWRDPTAPSGWSPGEIRVLQVQSGGSPRTELMVAAPATVPGAAARQFLEVLSSATQTLLTLAAPVG
ncbi:MAG TPA: hypothetical protein VFN68_15615 [Acidimicrobiales bacterium]|nr:hypothetical protein [Acidimicrobiales bacterium]